MLKTFFCIPSWSFATQKTVHSLDQPKSHTEEIISPYDTESIVLIIPFSSFTESLTVSINDQMTIQSRLLDPLSPRDIDIIIKTLKTKSIGPEPWFLASCKRGLVERESQLEAYVMWLCKRWKFKKENIFVDRRTGNPLMVAQSGPGGGKTYFLSYLSLFSPEIINPNWIQGKYLILIVAHQLY